MHAYIPARTSCQRWPDHCKKRGLPNRSIMANRQTAMQSQAGLDAHYRHSAVSMSPSGAAQAESYAVYKWLDIQLSSVQSKRSSALKS